MRRLCLDISEIEDEVENWEKLKGTNRENFGLN